MPFKRCSLRFAVRVIKIEGQITKRASHIMSFSKKLFKRWSQDPAPKKIPPNDRA